MHMLSEENMTALPMNKNVNVDIQSNKMGKVEQTNNFCFSQSAKQPQPPFSRHGKTSKSRTTLLVLQAFTGLPKEDTRNKQALQFPNPRVYLSGFMLFINVLGRHSLENFEIYRHIKNKTTKI